MFVWSEVGWGDMYFFSLRTDKASAFNSAVFLFYLATILKNMTNSDSLPILGCCQTAEKANRCSWGKNFTTCWSEAAKSAVVESESETWRHLNQKFRQKLMYNRLEDL